MCQTDRLDEDPAKGLLDPAPEEIGLLPASPVADESRGVDGPAGAASMTFEP